VLAVVIRNLPKLAGDPIHGVRPSAVDAGWLAGGPVRAVEAANAGLLAAGTLRADSGGLLRSTGDTTARDGLTADILEWTQDGHSAPEVFSRLRRRTALWEVGTALSERRLLVWPQVETRYRLLAAVPTLAVLIVGVVRLVNGISLGRPVGFLWAALGATVVLLIVLVASRRQYLRTRAGDQVLRELRRTPSSDVAMAVALLGGLQHYPDARIAEALRKSADQWRRRNLAGTAGGAAAGYFIGGGSSCGGSGGGSSCGGGGGGCCGGGAPDRGSASASAGGRRST
jgi:uncharacterized protein (TIGR04222 family)